MKKFDLLQFVFFPGGGLNYCVLTTEKGSNHSRYTRVCDALRDGWVPISATETTTSLRRKAGEEAWTETQVLQFEPATAIQGCLPQQQLPLRITGSVQSCGVR